MSVVEGLIESNNSPTFEVTPASANNPVQIILTPPTPIISTTTNTLGRRGEDTHKEVHRLPDVSEEKEVVERTDFSDEKQFYSGCDTHDEKEVYVRDVGKEVYDVGVEKETLNLKLHDGHDEKQLYDPNGQTQGIYEDGKEVLTNSTTNTRRDSVSTESTETSQSQAKASPFCYKRHINKLNEAVDKKKKAWTTFTNNSSTAMTEKVNQMDKSFTQRCDVFEESTMAKMSALDRSISDGVDRAGKNYTTTVASLKMGMVNKTNQSLSSMKSLGSKYHISGKGGKKDVQEDK